MGKHAMPEGQALADRQALRTLLEDRVTACLDALDALDALDEDCEDDEREPSLGAPCGLNQLRWGCWETAPDECEDGGDDEPWLGSPGTFRCESQVHWAQGGDARDREAEDEHGGDVLDEPHDGDTDSEASLSARTALWDQRKGWAAFGENDGRDLERDPASP